MERFSTQMSSGRKLEYVVKERIYDAQERLIEYPVGSPMYDKYWDDLQILRSLESLQSELDKAWDKGRDFGYDDGYSDGYFEGYDDGSYHGEYF